ncbi:hypothetical protein C8Q80DRAFT_737682 [Daedaleopsis nitida]|nr:hypothetical protein C8Q80DRAFT_737682 [Daedaleopsis nitida]
MSRCAAGCSTILVIPCRPTCTAALQRTSCRLHDELHIAQTEESHPPIMSYNHVRHLKNLSVIRPIPFGHPRHHIRWWHEPLVSVGPFRIHRPATLSAGHARDPVCLRSERLFQVVLVVIHRLKHVIGGYEIRGQADFPMRTAQVDEARKMQHAVCTAYPAWVGGRKWLEEYVCKARKLPSIPGFIYTMPVSVSLFHAHTIRKHDY